MKVIEYDNTGCTVYRRDGFPKMLFDKWLVKLRHSLIMQYKHKSSNVDFLIKELKEYWCMIWILNYTPSEGVQYFNHLCKDHWNWDLRL